MFILMLSSCRNIFQLGNNNSNTVYDEASTKEIDKLFKENRAIFKDLKKTIEKVFSKEKQLSKRIKRINEK